MKYLSLVRKNPYLAALRQPAVWMALPLLLSAGQIADTYAPFALAAVAAAGPGVTGVCSLIGAAAGALLFFDFQTGLRYVATAVLIFSANVAFYDSPLYEKESFLPAVSAVMLALVQSAYLIEEAVEQWVLCAAASAILAFAVWSFRSLKQKTEDSCLLLLTALLLSVHCLMPSFSPARSILAALVLLLSGNGSLSRSVALGGGIGLLLDLTPSPPRLLFAAVYAVSAGAAHITRRQTRLMMALAFCLPCAALPVLFGAEQIATLACEALLGGIIYILLPRRIVKLAALEPTKDATSDSFQKCLAQSAAAFRDLYDSFFRGTKPPPPENPAVIFDRAAQQVCRGCSMCSTCWQQNYHALYNAFNEACPPLLKRGEAQAQDFPRDFTARCVHFPELMQAINQEVRAFLLRRQYHQRLLLARQQAQEQYAQLGDLLSSADSAVPAMTQPMGYRIGSALRPREGEHICGDQVAVFEVGATLYLLLSDGMGSGESAHREAAMVVRLLQQFLKAGIDAMPALKTLNAAMALRGESGGGFTTIDLLTLHRGNGEAVLYKYGAAPSYLKKTGCITRITGQSLPAGLQSTGDTPECTHLTLPAGSFLVMVSDGIADANEDEWLQNLLAGWNGQDCDALVSLLLSESRSRKGLSDDSAILVLHLPTDGHQQV